MKLYPKGDTPEAAGYLSVYLSNQVKFKPSQWPQGSEDSMTTAVLTVNFPQTETEVKARYEFTILDVSKNKQNRVKSTFTQFKVGIEDG